MECRYSAAAGAKLCRFIQWTEVMALVEKRKTRAGHARSANDFWVVAGNMPMAV